MMTKNASDAPPVWSLNSIFDDFRSILTSDGIGFLSIVKIKCYTSTSLGTIFLQIADNVQLTVCNLKINENKNTHQLDEIYSN